MGAQIHTWEPPLLESTVDERVVIASVVGPAPLAKQIEEQLLASVPSDNGRAMNVVSVDGLELNEEIKLVSFDEREPSDLALASVARSEGIGFILRGQVIDSPSPDATDDSEQRLSVSWRLSRIDEQASSGGRPVVVDLESAIDRYPDLAILTDTNQILVSACVRDTYRLMIPSIQRDRIQLAIPYLSLGAAETRRGNLEARQGRWGEAEKIWQAVVDKHPRHASAIHNLAIAAAAGQDFSRAKQLARRAIRLRPYPLHKKTLVWIELSQRAYHESFGLPDPPEGWFVTR